MLSVRSLVSTVEKQSLCFGARYFCSQASKKRLPLETRVSNFGVGFFQKWLNWETATYNSWKGPKGITDPKAAEMYERAEAAATRRKIDQAMEKKKQASNES